MKRLFLLGLFLVGCGIKANPQVLKEPEVTVKRIGDRVYVKSLSGEIKIRDFEKLGDYWIKRDSSNFCFLVERIGGKSKRFCVDRSLEDMPSIKLLEEEDHAKLIAYGFEEYRLYSMRGGLVLLESPTVFKAVINLQRDYWERCYALTGLREGKETEFLSFCIKPKEPPPVEDVKNPQIRLGDKRLYLVWFYEGEYREFVVYKDGKEAGRTVGFAFELPIPEGDSIYTIKVINPLGFESKGISIDYRP
ncbi:MAG: hypothetical protein ACK4OF_05170 [Aquificaceae bacterium]